MRLKIKEIKTYDKRLQKEQKIESFKIFFQICPIWVKWKSLTQPLHPEIESFKIFLLNLPNFWVK